MNSNRKLVTQLKYILLYFEKKKLHKNFPQDKLKKNMFIQIKRVKDADDIPMVCKYR